MPLHQGVDRLDHQEEDHQGHDHERQHGVEEGPVGDLRSVDGERQPVELGAATEDGLDQRGDQIAHEGVHHTGERGADDHGHRQVEQVAPQQKLLELLHHAASAPCPRSAPLAHQDCRRHGPATSPTAAAVGGRSSAGRNRQAPRVDRRGPTPPSDRWPGPYRPQRPVRSSQSITVARCDVGGHHGHQAPAGMVLGDPPPLGQRQAEVGELPGQMRTGCVLEADRGRSGGAVGQSLAGHPGDGGHLVGRATEEGERSRQRAARAPLR